MPFDPDFDPDRKPTGAEHRANLEDALAWLRLLWPDLDLALIVLDCPRTSCISSRR